MGVIYSIIVMTGGSPGGQHGTGARSKIGGQQGTGARSKTSVTFADESRMSLAGDSFRTPSRTDQPVPASVVDSGTLKLPCWPLFPS